MEIQERLNIIESLMVHLYNYKNGFRVNIGPEEKQQIQTVYRDIYNTKINTGCITCIVNGLEFLEAYYLKEIQNYPKSEPVQEMVTTGTSEPVPEKRKPCKTCKKKG